MGLKLQFQNSGASPSGQATVEMAGGAMTIGRGAANDLTLPDPERTLSKRHCVLEEQDGQYVIVDISTNGTYLNYGQDRLSEIPTPLNHGDVIQLGAYELVVEITADATPGGSTDLLPPASERSPGAEPFGPAGPLREPAFDPLDETDGDDDFLAALLDGSDSARPARPPESGRRPGQGASHSNHGPASQDHFSAPLQSRPLIPDDWDDFSPDAEAAGGSDPIMPSEDDPFRKAPTPSPRPAASAPSSSPTPRGVEAARAFLEGAGVGHVDIPEAELADAMARMGRVFAGMVKGLREVLLTRASIKSEMRMNRTLINAGGNNPLKFSISQEQAVEAMIRPSVRGYLDAEAATDEALDDIKAHEVAMMSGMEAALKDLLTRLGPEHLAARIETASSVGHLLRGKKARYWEAYEAMYKQISKETADDFQSTFGREFARAYEQQLDKLKRR